MGSMMDGDRPQVSIDEALAGGWFELWYQPKIDLKRKCLAGAEALARIRHPVHGDLGPGAFIPIVGEDSIAHLTEYALISALTDWSRFEQAGFDLHLSVNVPMRALRTLPVCDIVNEYRPRSERWPGIVLEVTGDEIARDLAFAQQIAVDLRSCGVTIGIDDFGADCSTFASLREFPYGELKLDRSFVKDCAVDAVNAAICQTAIDLVHHFDSAAVAGGVESQTDLRALMAMGCDFGQGPVIAPLMPQEQFLDMLLQRPNSSSAPAPAADHRASGPESTIGRVA